MSTAKDLFKQFETSDDVYSEVFSRHVIVQAGNAEIRALRQVETLIGTGSFEDVAFLSKSYSGARLPPGPYFVRGCSIYQAWRLYTDDLDAFSVAVVPEDLLSPDR